MSIKKNQISIKILKNKEKCNSNNALKIERVFLLKKIINSLHPSDISFILSSIPEIERKFVFSLVKSENDGNILLEIESWARKSLIETIDKNDLLAIIYNMNADELANLTPNLPIDIVVEVQKGLTENERYQLLEIMGYPENSVGAIMDFEMVRVRENVTLNFILNYLRKLHELPDHLYQIFIVDKNDKLQGILQITQILMSNPDIEVKKVMNIDYLTLKPSDLYTEAAGAFERYNLISAPVVDDKNRLIGRVTIEDVVDIIREYSQEQDLSRAGLQEEDIFAPVDKAIFNRTPWLLINLCTAFVVSTTSSYFSKTVEQIVILSFLMSIVAGIAGNSGNQTMTIVIRALAIGKITSQNIFKLIKREIIVTLLVCLFGSVIASFFTWFLSASIKISVLMIISMTINMVMGAIMGVIIPMIRSKFGKDPAIGSSVILTFTTDLLGFILFLGLSTIFLI